MRSSVNRAETTRGLEIGEIGGTPRMLQPEKQERRNGLHASKNDLPVEILGEYEACTAEWGDYMAYFERIAAGMDYSAYYETCEVPHWGYVFKGKIRFIYDDGDETVLAGEAYHAPPGHKFEVLEDAETLEFSPTAEYRQQLEIVARNMQAASTTPT